MWPSISVSLEPGLERGVPWGRDLYTFVTSAAGHMMRTLQKPRKNRPSKRQVNHRRFLHNMIQRKFADIEAANHRLASALYKDEEKNASFPPSQKPDTLDQSGSPSQGVYPQDSDKCRVHTDADVETRSDVSLGSHETEIGEKKQPDSGHLEPQPTTCTAGKNNQSKERQKQERRNQLSSSSSMSSSKGTDHHHGAELLHAECYDDGSQQKSANDPSEDSTQQDSGFIQLGQNADISPCFSPELSPLSLDSCDFSIQMFTDISTCTQDQRSTADISESQWTDILDLFSVGNKNSGGCMDLEAYLESIRACQGNAGQEVGAGEFGLADQSDSFCNRSEVEDLHYETGEYRYEYNCHGDQGLTINHFHNDQRSSPAPRQNEDAPETQFNNFKPNQETDIIQNQLLTSISYHYNAAELHTYRRPQEESPCRQMVNSENNQNFAPFEGVAQSFSVPLHNPEHRPIPTPPHEDDWPFTDILKERK